MNASGFKVSLRQPQYIKNVYLCAECFCHLECFLKVIASLSNLIPPVSNYLTNLVSVV